MSFGLSITFRDRATQALEALGVNLGSARLADRAGTAVAVLVRGRLRKKPDNKKGWPSTGFWRDAANSVSHYPVEGGQVVSIAKIGMRQRFFGGSIRPVNAQALTIPISPEAYGHTAADFPGAFLLKTKTGAYLVRYTNGRGRNALFDFLFKLSGGVDQPPDPSVLPSKDEMLAVANEAILKGVLPRSKGASN